MWWNTFRICWAVARLLGSRTRQRAMKSLNSEENSSALFSLGASTLDAITKSALTSPSGVRITIQNDVKGTKDLKGRHIRALVAFQNEEVSFEQAPGRWCRATTHLLLWNSLAPTPAQAPSRNLSSHFRKISQVWLVWLPSNTECL